MIGIYIRVSPHAQKSDSQRAEIRQWLELHGHDPDTVWWFEDQETGATLNREAFTLIVRLDKMHAPRSDYEKKKRAHKKDQTLFPGKRHPGHLPGRYFL